MHIGTVIKIERLRQEMKQETLAKGICSTAHLSRIENGISIPSQKVLNELSDRLGIPLENKKNSKEKQQMKLDEISDQSIIIINKRDQEGASHLIQQISETLKIEMLDIHLKVDLDLLMLRLLLVQKGNGKKVLQETKKYEEIESALTPLQKFRVNMMNGIASYGCGNLKNSLESFSNAAKLLDNSLIPPFDRADFSYVHSVALMADFQKFTALEKAKYSLDYFKSEMANQRAVECLLVCGVAYKQIGQLEKALEQLHEAKRICRGFQMKSFFGIVFQNLGHAYMSKGDFNLAIEHFKKSLLYKEKSDKMAYTVFSLVKAYKELNNPEEVLYWLQEGYRILPKLSRSKKILFEKHFNVYRSLYSNNNNKIESELVVAFEYFKVENKTKQMKEYAKMLAEFYTKMGRYRNAVYYYKMIVE